MFQTVPGGLGKWENMPSGKVPQSLITWEKSERAVLGEEGGGDGQMGRWNSLFSAHLPSDGSSGWEQTSVSQLCDLPRQLPTAPEGQGGYCVGVSPLASSSWACAIRPP